MKTKKWKMKTLRVMLLLVIAVFTLTPLQAQKLIKKELKTENSKQDGFQYQWYMYTYSMGNSTLMAAFDLNGKRITPNGYKISTEDPGVMYLGGGMFMVGLKNKDAFGERIVSGYNINGKCVFSGKNCYYIFYTGDGLFKLNFHNNLGKRVQGLYDYNGNCIISEDKGYDFIFSSGWEGFYKGDPIITAKNKDKKLEVAYDAKGNCIIPESLGYNSVSFDDCFIRCRKENSNGETYVKHTFSKDGRYYVEGDLYSYSLSDIEEFEKNKKPVSTLGGSYASGNASSNSSSSSSSTTTTTTVTPTPTPQPQPQPIRQPQPMQVWKPCVACGGSGQCHICLGTGHSLQNPNSTCILCNGTGKCTHCAGHGGQNVIEYH